MSIDVAAYLARIGLDGPALPDVKTLRAMHWAHLQHVPFENLDILPLRRPIALEPDALFAKIVRRHRGGFCYELNGLLATVLRQIGFEVTLVSTQFILDDGLSPAFDHLSLIVAIPGEEGRWLADVGCGNDSPAYPLALRDGFEEFQAETNAAYRIERADDRWRIQLKEADGEWSPRRTFTETPQQLADFSERCVYQQTGSDSHFTQGPLCSMNVPGGRVTISKGRLIETVDGLRTERELEPGEFEAVLMERFGVDLAAPGFETQG